jgi:hypothetical protein
VSIDDEEIVDEEIELNISQTQCSSTPIRSSSRSTKGKQRYSTDFIYSNVTSLKPTSQSSSLSHSQSQSQSQLESQSKSQNKKRGNDIDDDISPKKLIKSKNKVFSHTENNSLYKLYDKSFDKELLSELQENDKIASISGLLSYVINHNWVNDIGIIELVDTKQLWNFKEVNRLLTPKGDTSLKFKCGSIMELGFFEPLTLSYDNESTSCLLEEGNSRLAYAYLNNIPFVPVKVVHGSHHNEGHKVLVPDKTKVLCPSNLGFDTIQNYPLHPYLSVKLSNELKKQKFEDPYVIGYQEAVVSETHPELI